MEQAGFSPAGGNGRDPGRDDAAASGVGSLHDYLLNQQEYSFIIQQAKEQKFNLIHGVSGGQRAFLAAAIARDQGKSILYIAENTQRAREAIDDFSFWLPEYQTLFFPALDIISFDVIAQSKETRWKRLETIQALLFSDEPLAVVTTVDAMRKTMLPAPALAGHFRGAKTGDRIDITELVTWLIERGYERVERVEEKGQIALRGGILDVYCPTAPWPWRLEFFDDEVDSIRFFAPETQRSTEKTGEAFFSPASECVFTEKQKDTIIDGLRQEKKISQRRRAGRQRGDTSVAGINEDIVSRMDRAQTPGDRADQLIEMISEYGFFPGHEQLLPYAGEGHSLLSGYFRRPPLTVMTEPFRQSEASQLWEKDYNDSFLDLLEKGRVCPGQVRNFVSLNDMIRQIGESGLMFLALLPRRPAWFANINTLGITAKSVSLYLQKTQLLADEIKEWKRMQYCVMILVNSPDRGRRLRDSLRDLSVESGWIAGGFKPAQGGVFIMGGEITGGFDLPGCKLAVISEYELFHQPKKKAARKIFKEGRKRILLDDLSPGDYIVHVNYGIGRYQGIENITIEQTQRDYLVINYSGTDRLYVPTDQAELLQKYTGQEGSRPKLSRLGGGEWAKAKAKAKKAVNDMAEELLELYAAREALPGIAFDKDTIWQREFEDMFPYEETPDQARSIDEVKIDMEKPRPMDRLLCGDVGYGKTEVAMRSAFKAVASGKQVAILVPTTVLAQQHFSTFRERFDGFSMEVAVLNRFRRPVEQKETLRRLKEGKVDILIGTHRILSSDVEFKNLGLLVVDEEQRFGVGHKEKIKKLKQSVDVLTLTATPIPRTLHMALSGMRDMSVIETAPEDRYPVQTYVVEHSEPLVREAILRELGRGGQVYYVHNRIEDIDKVREGISALVPDARVASAHGRMTEATLERIMFSFMEGEIDVLVCTTIIESGLDISNANTVIINHADRLGLAQLYQIRGRVGRSSRVAYAYLTYTKDKTITEVAEKRMTAIREFTELGAGYKIAMRDLEIRGAGNILGAEQHGQIAAVGFDLYCRMLEDAMKKKRKEKATGQVIPDEPDDALETTTIDLRVRAFIPSEYMDDESAKIDFYQRINNAENIADIDDLREEMVDRFGDLPRALENLLSIGSIKALAKEAKVSGFIQEKNRVRIIMNKEHNLTSSELVELVKSFQRRVSFQAAERLEITIQLAKIEEEDILRFLLSVTQALKSLSIGTAKKTG